MMIIKIIVVGTSVIQFAFGLKLKMAIFLVEAVSVRKFPVSCKIQENNLVLNASKRMKLQQFPWQYVAIVNYMASVHLASFQYQW